MDTPTSFPHADFLNQLESLGVSTCPGGWTLPAPLTQALRAVDESAEPARATAALIQLLRARREMWRTSFETGVVAEALRRYQKFARPGQPTAHIVQLRQQQAAARRASSQSGQSFVIAAAAFVRVAGIEVPQRVALEPFVIDWIDANVPKGVVATPR
jgi:hypothetical protein